MKKQFGLLVCAISLISLNIQAQLPKHLVFIGGSAGYYNQFNVWSLPVGYQYCIPKTDIQIMGGVRQTLGFGQSAFTINKQKTTIDDISNYSVNLMIGASYQCSFGGVIGFNIDLAGATFGTRSYKTVGKDPIYSVKPETINVLLGGDNDRGSLNSTFYIGYRFKNNLLLQGGFAHYGMAYKYSGRAADSRSITFVNVPYIQVEYPLWISKKAE
ncbi:MAG: hypothetical protein MUE96_00305 [Bacteroidia bacterium]|jgi:hypothetical protein|nr:hypothetical protein [Bacteroidia bacterium]